MDALPLKDFNLIMKTENPTKKIKFQWTIRNISKLPGPIVSSKFALASGQPLEWDVSIKREPSGDTFQFSLAYHPEEEHADPILVSSHSRILNKEGNVLERNFQSTHQFKGGDQHPLCSRLEFTDQPDDKLVLQCSLTVHGYGLVCSRDLYSSDDRDVENLANDYLSMLTSKEFADVEIMVLSQWFPVHSCVLKHLAPKFFSIHHKEILQGKFIFMGTTPDMFEVLLQSIYSGKVNLAAIALWSAYQAHAFVPLYSLSSRYELKPLLRECILDVVYSMKKSNVCAFYRMAELREDEKLVKYCEAFMRDNVRDLESNAYYLRFRDDRPHLPRTIKE